MMQNISLDTWLKVLDNALLVVGSGQILSHLSPHQVAELELGSFFYGNVIIQPSRR